MIKIYIFTFLFLLSSMAHAQDNKKYKFFKIKYISEPNDNIARIFKKFVFPDSIINRNTPMTQKTIIANPQIKNWEAVPPGSKLTLYIQAEFMDMSRYKEYVAQLKKGLQEVKKKKEEEQETENAKGLPEGLKASLFYMASYGKFSQSNPQYADVTFMQNSPVTLGASFSFYPKKSDWSFAWSTYFSYLLAAGNNLDSSNVTVPPEIGATAYSEYRFKNYNFTGYFGLDYEQFSTFNMGGIQRQRKILLDQNTALYFTVGVSKLVHVFGSPFFTKLSFSKSVMTSLDPNADGIISDGAYDGFKFLWYVNKKFSQKLYLHTLFKYHSMDGPSKLSTLRLGVGFGYILF